MAVRIGFIGTGGIAGAHRKSLVQIPNAQMVAFCDADEQRANAAAEEHGGKAYTSYQAMLSDAQLDAVYICLPPCFHGEFEDAVIEAGLPFFIEKPLDVDLQRARRTAAKVAEQGLITGVGYHWRHYDSIDWLQAAIGERPIGLALGYWLGGTPGVWWWRKQETSGGQMVEQATHITDLARYLMGEVTSVYAQYNLYRMHQKLDGLDVADAGSATLTFENGAVCQIATTCALEGHGQVGLDVHFGGQVAEIRAGTVTVKGAGADGVSNKNLVNPTVREDTFFVNAVDGVGDPALIRSPYADALKTLAVTLAMNESAASGQVVALAGAEQYV
ncbi:MAG: Gfo/Idh/MocA family oxidoreductase [Armatimonadetes bacterium]|nr:Gfo/Idh/MocA family oxidoreductase [Armatimonadota bacterium]